jgi:hypothetical protein
MSGDHDFYDDETWALITRWHAERASVPAEVSHGWRASVGAAAIFSAAAFGVADVIEPKHRDPVFEEVDLDSLLRRDDMPVVYHHVPGAPRASRAVVRPWLF